MEVQIEQYSPKGKKEIKYLDWNYFSSHLSFPTFTSYNQFLNIIWTLTIFKLMQKHFFQVVDLLRKLNKLYHPWTFEKNIVFFSEKNDFLFTNNERTKWKKPNVPMFKYRAMIILCNGGEVKMLYGTILSVT